MSKEDKNKATILRVFEEVFNKGNLSIADEIIAPGWVYHGPLGEFKGVEGFKQIVVGVRQAFPDVHMTIDDIVGEGDKVAVRFTMTGTFKGEMRGIPPTGKKATLPISIICHLVGGKEVETFEFFDMLGFFQQLGVKAPAG
jgi:predicted ester cyclase